MEPPPEYRARPPTPAALPISCTRARRSTAAATNMKIDRDVRTLRGNTNLKAYPFSPSKTISYPRLSDSHPILTQQDRV